MLTPAAAARLTTWPLAGTPEFALVDVAWRGALAHRLLEQLEAHVIRVWFPRCIDDAGGYWAEHDMGWQRRGDGSRMLEFQARQMRTCARLGLAFPSQAERWCETALHGLDFLATTMLDDTHGGWFWRVDRAGVPLHGGTKHAHGTSYLLPALLAVSELTGDRRATDLLEHAVEWLESHHHDERHGGYLGWVTRAGRPILAAGDVPPGVQPAEPLGHGIALKDANVTSDMLDGYTLLAAAHGDTRATRRLDELYSLFLEHLVTTAGGVHYAVHRDWTPAPEPERTGYVIQQVHRLPAAAAVLGRADAMVVARRLMDHALAEGWDDDAAAFVSRPHGVPGSEPEWWLQADGLRSLTFLAVTCPDEPRYARHLERLLTSVERHFLDGRRGGWHRVPPRALSFRSRLRGEPAKGTHWKDASHETDAYLACIRMLRGLPAGAALE